MPGYYRCCVFKWIKIRERDHWSLLCDAAPKLAKKNKELSDAMRKFFGNATKFTARASALDATATSLVPRLLQDVVGQTVALCLYLLPCILYRCFFSLVYASWASFANKEERISVGEEVDMVYVSDALRAGIELWNECTDKVKALLSDPVELLRSIEIETLNEDAMQAALEEKAAHLKKIVLTDGDALMQLACVLLSRHS